MTTDAEDEEARNLMVGREAAAYDSMQPTVDTSASAEVFVTTACIRDCPAGRLAGRAVSAVNSVRRGLPERATTKQYVQDGPDAPDEAYDRP